jgi:putative oxidoreductase
MLFNYLTTTIMTNTKCACTLKVLARILFGLPMVAFGVVHFMMGTEMSAYVPSYLPAPTLLVYLTGLVLFLGGLAILLNKYVDYLATALGLMLLSFALLIHLPLLLSGDQMAMTNLLKDTALAGAAFYFAGVCCYKKCHDGHC